jgi:hypothetical protein
MKKLNTKHSEIKKTFGLDKNLFNSILKSLIQKTFGFRKKVS